MQFSDKLQQLIDKLGLNENSFASEIGVTSTAVYNMTGPRKSKPSHDFWEKVKARWPHIDLNPFFDESTDIQGSLTVITEPVANYGAEPGRIPVITHKAAANSLSGIEANEPIETSSYIQMPKEIVGTGTLIALQAKGQSMQPVIHDGSFVILKHLDRSEWGDIKNGRIYMVHSQDYGSQIKYVRRSERNPELLILESENPEHDMITVNLKDVMQIWEWRLTLSLKWTSIKRTFFEKLDRLEQGYYELAVEVKQLKDKQQKAIQ